MFELVSITINGNEHRSHLLDLSTHGAKIHCRTALEPAQQVILRSDTLVRRASVEWTTTSGSAGLSFSHALPPTAVTVPPTRK